jgi:hypothetical protein
MLEKFMPYIWRRAIKEQKAAKLTIVVPTLNSENYLVRPEQLPTH